MTFFEQVQHRLATRVDPIVVQGDNFVGVAKLIGDGLIRVKYATPIGFCEATRFVSSSHIPDRPKQAVSSSVETIGKRHDDKIIAIVDGTIIVTELDLESIAKRADQAKIASPPCDSAFVDKLDMILRMVHIGDEIERLLAMSVDDLKQSIVDLVESAIDEHLNNDGDTIDGYDVVFYVKPKPGATTHLLTNLLRLEQATGAEWMLVKSPSNVATLLAGSQA